MGGRCGFGGGCGWLALPEDRNWTLGMCVDYFIYIFFGRGVEEELCYCSILGLKEREKKVGWAKTILSGKIEIFFNIIHYLVLIIAHNYFWFHSASDLRENLIYIFVLFVIQLFGPNFGVGLAL